MRLNTLGHLLKGNPDLINPDAPLEEQVALLPYDSKWEFPRDQLILEKQLASGHFGVVFQGKTKMKCDADGGLYQNEDTGENLLVAVKMVKGRTDPTALESLVSELKILSYLGSHLNIVNLIGACTLDIEQGFFSFKSLFCF